MASRRMWHGFPAQPVAMFLFNLLRKRYDSSMFRD
jgi:hypothetical protein